MNKALIRFAWMGSFAGMALSSQAFTWATFADPALDETTPLFTVSASSITGGWNGSGLLLQTPGWAAPDYADAQFSMAPVAISLVVPGFYTLGAGQIDFADNVGNPVFTINFASGFLSPNGVGGSDLFSNNVTFSGPGVPVGLTQETFNFSFANIVPTADGFTATASFTSSAVPEPATLAALGIGFAALLRRRRKA